MAVPLGKAGYSHGVALPSLCEALLRRLTIVVLGKRGHWAGTWIMFGACLISGCALSPATGRPQLALISESEEIALGQRLHSELQRAGQLQVPGAASALVTEVGSALAARSERPHLEWTFSVLDDPAINAAALPGGHVYITRGLLALLNNRAELAAVLGHELGHVTARHGVVHYSRQKIAQRSLGIFRVIDPQTRHVGAVVGGSMGLLMLRHGRRDEDQADHLSLNYTRAIHEDPRALLDVLQLLAAVGRRDGATPPAWLSSHPEPSSRYDKISRELAGAQAIERVDPPEAPFWRGLEGLTYGRDLRRGYLENGDFHLPRIGLGFQVPPEWPVAVGVDEMLAIAPKQEAALWVHVLAVSDDMADQRRFLLEHQLPVTEPTHEAMGAVEVITRTFGQADSDQVIGFVTDVRREHEIVRFLALAITPAWNRHGQVLAKASGSMRSLSPQERDVRSASLKMITLNEATTLAALADTHKIRLAHLIALNRVDAQSPLPAGRVVKVLEGSPVALQ